MGTAIFAARKISLTRSIQNLEQMMTAASEQQYALANQSMQLSNQSSLISIYMSQVTDATQQQYYNEQQLQIDSALASLQEQEEQLQLQIKAMETDMSMLTQELSTVEQAEANTIKRGTPHYSATG